jgi:truncated hemoglobin YjbI
VAIAHYGGRVMRKHKRLERLAGTLSASCSAEPSSMSEFTRAQILSLMQRAADAIRRCQEIRRELDGVMKRIEETGHATRDAEDRTNTAKGVAAK